MHKTIAAKNRNALEKKIQMSDDLDFIIFMSLVYYRKSKNTQLRK